MKKVILIIVAVAVLAFAAVLIRKVLLSGGNTPGTSELKAVPTLETTAEVTFEWEKAVRLQEMFGKFEDGKYISEYAGFKFIGAPRWYEGLPCSSFKLTLIFHTTFWFSKPLLMNKMIVNNFNFLIMDRKLSPKL